MEVNHLRIKKIFKDQYRLKKYRILQCIIYINTMEVHSVFLLIDLSKTIPLNPQNKLNNEYLCKIEYSDDINIPKTMHLRFPKPRTLTSLPYFEDTILYKDRFFNFKIAHIQLIYLIEKDEYLLFKSMELIFKASEERRIEKELSRLEIERRAEIERRMERHRKSISTLSNLTEDQKNVLHSLYKIRKKCSNPNCNQSLNIYEAYENTFKIGISFEAFIDIWNEKDISFKKFYIHYGILCCDCIKEFI